MSGGKPRSCCESRMRENRTSGLSGGRRVALRRPSSDQTPEKSANKAGVRKPAAELMEERERAKGNPSTQTSHRAQYRTRLPHDLDGIRRAVLTAWPSPPEAGAQCVNRARWDLCGGRRATGGPTATSLARISALGDVILQLVDQIVC